MYPRTPPSADEDDRRTASIRPWDDRTTTGVCFEEFNVTQGFLQGCMLSPLLFKIFAAVLLVAPQRFSKDPDVLVDLAYLREHPERVGWEMALECIRHAE